MRSVNALAALLVAILAVRPAASQEPPPTNSDVVLPVATEVVRLDVVVTEKGGRPRGDLKPADFVVLEDGQPQPIVQFEAYATVPVAAPAEPVAAAQVGTPEAPKPQPTSAPRRYVVLVVDDLHIEASNLLRMKKTVDRFLEREIGPEDQVALVTTSGTGGLSQEFTSDSQALRRSVARVSVQDRTFVSIRAPYMTEYQAELIERGDGEALRIAAQEIRDERQTPDAETEAKGIARMVLDDSLHHARMTLETLDGVVRSLSDLKARKVVVLVTDGFVTGLTISASGAYDIRRVTDACTRAGVIIYSLNTRGLVATLPGRSASSRMPSRDNTFNARDMMSRASEHATKDAMNALAADTGGFMVENTNDLGSGLRKILKDTETYYLIAYEPTNTRRDGGFRKIEVRLPGVRDVRIRTRKGYFAPEDRKAKPSGTGGASPTVADEARSADERRLAGIKSALTAVVPQDGIPVRLAADFVSVDGSATQIVVSSHVDLRGVPFSRAGDRHVASVDAAALVFDESGAVVGKLPAERADMDLTDAAYERALKDGLPYQRASPMKAGRYRVRFAAREDGGGRLGSVSQWVQVPNLADGKLTLSSLFLLEKEEPKGGAAPGSADGGLSLRGAQALRRFKNTQTLYVQLFAYNPARDAAGATNLVTQAEVWRGGVRLASAAPEPMAQGGSRRSSGPAHPEHQAHALRARGLRGPHGGHGPEHERDHVGTGGFQHRLIQSRPTGGIACAPRLRPGKLSHPEPGPAARVGAACGADPRLRPS